MTDKNQDGAEKAEQMNLFDQAPEPETGLGISQGGRANEPETGLGISQGGRANEPETGQKPQNLRPVGNSASPLATGTALGGGTYSKGAGTEAGQKQKDSGGIPLEMDHDRLSHPAREVEQLRIPARWEAVQDIAEKNNVLPSLLRQLKRVRAIDYVQQLISLSSAEGYAWVVYGVAGCGKSTFFHTLEYQTNKAIGVHIVNPEAVDIKSERIEQLNLSDQRSIIQYLNSIIKEHREKRGEEVPLVIVLENRENEMPAEERSAISQALKNVLRPPGIGTNTIFVIPVTNSSQGELFLTQAQSTGVATPSDHNSIYVFQGPPHTEHVEIFESLVRSLYGHDISHYGLERSGLQKLVSSTQSIGEFIRRVRGHIVSSNDKFKQTYKIHNYRPITVVFCFVNPLYGYTTQPVIKGMTIDAYGRINRGEILRATDSKFAKYWESKRSQLSNVIEVLDVRAVEVPPEILVKAIYAYGWDGVSDEIASHLKKKSDELSYSPPKSVVQNLRQQLLSTNLFSILTDQPTRRLPRKKSHAHREEIELEIVRFICSISKNRQQELHRMIALAVEDLVKNSGRSGLQNFRQVQSEAYLTIRDDKVVRPDIVVEDQERLVLLEFCWRSPEEFTDASIASYILEKIDRTYMHLPLIRQLAE